jgi:magnesium chelatase subunit D
MSPGQQQMSRTALDPSAPPAAAGLPRACVTALAGSTACAGLPALGGDSDAAASPAWQRATLAAAMMAIDPAALGGISLRSRAGPVRDYWLAMLAAWLPAGALHRVPLHVSEERLIGGLDLSATLHAGAPVMEPGLLTRADGGVVVLAMAERISAATAAHLCRALDTGQLAPARNADAAHQPARLGVLALDEGLGADEQPPAALLDRLAFLLDLGSVGVRDVSAPVQDLAMIQAARARMPQVRVSEDLVQAICAAATSLGITELRASWLAVQAARVAAALDGRVAVSETDAALAGQLVLAPRARQLPQSADGQEDEPQDKPEDKRDADGAARTPPRQEPRQDPAHPGEPSPQAGKCEAPAPEPAQSDATLADAEPRPPSTDDVVLAAVRTAIPPGLLAQLQAIGATSSRHASTGKAGHWQAGGLRGRPAGVRRGTLRSGARLNLIETLRAAAPWQTLRRAERQRAQSDVKPPKAGTATISAAARPVAPSIQVRSSDIRITRHQQRAKSATLFVVDASGSAALQRLGEAKGAIEILLADCYVRRDEVALIAFRGQQANLLLPPTRSLVRAKRCLGALPGGGGTPLAAGIDAAAQLADALLRRGLTPSVVLLTDGRANVTREGTGGRVRAQEEALAAARRLQAARFNSMLVDTAIRPQPEARRLAQAMGARYLALPTVDAGTLSQAVRSASI